jgi:hypothetical protein
MTDNERGQAALQGSVPLAVVLLVILGAVFDLSFGTLLVLTIPMLVVSLVLTTVVVQWSQQRETRSRGYWKPSKDGELQFPKDPTVYQRKPEP